jgi:hypothetical protein
MPNIRIDFTHCIQDAHEFGSDDEFMVSRVFFSATPSAGAPQEAHCDIKQAVGSSYETGKIEVGQIDGLKISINYEDFRAAAESYYRKLVGSSGMAIRIEGAANVRMYNNHFGMPWAVEIRSGDEKGGW